MQQEILIHTKDHQQELMTTRVHNYCCLKSRGSGRHTVNDDGMKEKTGLCDNLSLCFTKKRKIVERVTSFEETTSYSDPE